MDKVFDIEGNELNIGDEVFYARKQSYSANGELKKVKITNLIENKDTYYADQSPVMVMMGRYRATEPQKQIIKCR